MSTLAFAVLVAFGALMPVNAAATIAGIGVRPRCGGTDRLAPLAALAGNKSGGRLAPPGEHDFAACAAGFHEFVRSPKVGCGNGTESFRYGRRENSCVDK